MSSTPKPRNLEKELARKLAWAVLTTLEPPVHVRGRVRAWAWRLACKMVVAKAQFSLTNSPPPPDNGEAGGGADGVTRREAHLSGTPSARPLSEEVYAGFIGEGPDNVRGRSGGSTGSRVRSETACSNSGCRWWSGARCVRRPAGSDYRWRWDEAPEAPTQGLNSGRHADSPDYRECYLEESGRELRPAKNPEVGDGVECVL